ncbi:LPXTG cell wall anchor domain-containing protein [Microbacterium sp. P01]|uniref:LPXTG cell wall anchor domain-containing protein n=1 Tax=unclassified Microbacterium TaxID=2609290 RepID=UPI00366C3407
MRKITVALGIAALIAFAAPTAAFADDSAYPPDAPTTPSLTGSGAVSECRNDVPWINYSVVLTDPAGVSTSRSATLTLSNGSQTTGPIALGELVDNKLTGSVLWPGATVDAAGNPTDWPGWSLVNGSWVQDQDEFAWTRGEITATINVNPSAGVALSYPLATPDCVAGPTAATAAAAGGTGTLPATGMSDSVLPIGIAGGVIALLGGGLLVTRRLVRR